ncbi:MAG: YbhN family protein [Acidimicrobiales bacterium]
MGLMRRIPRPLRRTLAILVALAVLEYLVLPQVAGARKALHLLARVNPLLLLAGMGLEAASLVCYFELTRSLLPADRRPSMGHMSRVELSSLAISHLVPGGGAAGGALTYRLLTDAGTPSSDVAFALATQGAGSAVVLNAMLWLALIASIPTRGFQPLYTTAAVVGLVVVGSFVGVVLTLTRHEDAAASWLTRFTRPVRFLEPDAADRLVHRLAASLSELTRQPRLLIRAITWAAANWILDAASLWVFVAAFGYRVEPDALVVAYGLANVLGAIPITPGGLGIIEGVLTPVLVGFGAPRGVALLGVVSWRVVNFWLPIPVGGACYLSLRVGGREQRGRGRRAAELAQATVLARQDAEPLPQWAARTGVRLPAKIARSSASESGPDSDPMV